jgi:hypothetical protein
MGLVIYKEPIIIKGIVLRGESLHASMAYALSQVKPESDKIDLAAMHLQLVFSVDHEIVQIDLPFNENLNQYRTGKIFPSTQESLFKKLSNSATELAQRLKQHYPQAKKFICHGIIAEIHSLKEFSPQTKDVFTKYVQYREMQINPDFSHTTVLTPKQTKIEAAANKIKKSFIEEGISVESDDDTFLFLRFSCTTPGANHTISPREYSKEAIAKYFNLADEASIAQISSDYTIAKFDPDAPRQAAPKVRAVQKPIEKKAYPPGPHLRRKIEVDVGAAIPKSEDEFSAAGAAEIDNASPDLQALPQAGALKRSASATKTRTKKQAHFKAKNEVEEASQTIQYSSQSQTPVYQAAAAATPVSTGAAFARTHTGTDGSLLTRSGAKTATPATIAGPTPAAEPPSSYFFRKRQAPAPAKFSLQVKRVAAPPGSPTIVQNKASRALEGAKAKDEGKQQMRPPF